MVREFTLPDVGEGVAEGEIVQWLVEVGDTVEEDQPVVEVETDKAIVEIPSPVDGTVTELRAEEGDVVPVGDVMIVFEEAGQAATEADTATDATEATAEESEPAAEEGETPATDRVFAAPHVRRLARELGVDLAAVEGSGPGGRVTEGDVRAAAETDTDGETATEPGGGTPSGEPVPAGDPAEPSPDHATAEPAAERDRTLAAPATRRLAAELDVDLNQVPTTEERDGEAFVTPEAVRAFAERGAPADAPTPAGVEVPESREERVPYRGIRRTIGEHMVESASTAPHVAHHEEVNVQELVDVREELKPDAEERGIRLTYLPFVMKAVVGALKEHPYLNATLDEEAEEIVLKHYYHIGVATATENGLLVPVVEDVDRKGLLQLASEVAELTQKARDGSIARSEMQGGTFTITNVGAIGGEYGTPIIHQPQVAILALGAIDERPWVEAGEVVPRHTLPLSLSFDHRVLDGATAARFTNDVVARLERPTRLLLD